MEQLTEAAPQTAPTADEIFEFVDCNPDPVVIPEWGGRTVYLRDISAGDLDELNKKLNALGDDQVADGLCLVVIAVVSDEKGRPIFTEQHLEQLKTRNVHVLKKLQDMSLKKLGWEGKQSALKNVSGATGVDASASVSPENLVGTT